MDNAILEANKLGQSVWLDNIRRGMLRSGELERLVSLGVSGITSNPTIFEKAITGSSDYDDALLRCADEGMGPEETYEALAIADIRAAADLLRAHYDRTAGADGYVSMEVNPHLAHDTEATISEANRLFDVLDRPNVMVKVPATPQGVPAVHNLIGNGVNVNVTLLFSLDAYRDVRQAYIAGLEDLAWSGGDLDDTASVASFFVSRVDTAVDTQIEERAGGGDPELGPLMGKAAIANARVAYRDFRKDFDGERFAALGEKGAMVQRPLWASTSTKNPSYSDVMYPEALIGPDTVDTMPDATLAAFLEHGAAGRTIDCQVDEAEKTIEKLEAAGIGMAEVTDRLLADGLRQFAESYDGLLANIEEKSQLLAKSR